MHRQHRLLFIICKCRSIFLCVTTGSVALLVYKPFVYFIISLSNKVPIIQQMRVRVRVAPENPRVTRANHYLVPLRSAVRGHGLVWSEQSKVKSTVVTCHSHSIWLSEYR